MSPYLRIHVISYMDSVDDDAARNGKNATRR